MPTKARIARPKVRPRVRALRRDDWPIIETLFGKNGACGGCWCMTWRVERGGKLWEQCKGAKNKRAFKKLVTSGKASGCLAFVDDEPVGWCSIGPRGDFPRLQRSRVLKTDWTETTWSVTCFYIPTPWRRRGVATALLTEAIKLARTLGATELEGYPVRPYGPDKSDVPGAFAWTGIPKLFEKHKFINIAPPEHSREIYRRKFRRSPRARCP